HVSDSRNLAVHERRGPAECLETGSLLPVPTCGNLVVRQDGNEARTTSRRSQRDVAPGGPVAGGRREAVLEADLVQRILLQELSIGIPEMQALSPQPLEHPARNDDRHR